MPKKRNSAYKVVKKVSEAGSAQQRRIKNDVEMRAAVKEVAAQTLCHEQMEALEKELKERKECINSVVRSQGFYLYDMFKKSGVKKFSIVEKKEEITATVQDLASTCRLLYKLNCKIEERENMTKEKTNAALNNLLSLKQRDNVQKDIIELHRRPKRKNTNKSKEELENRMDILTKEIQSTTEKFEEKILLEKEKQSMVNSKNKTLENYIKGNIDELKGEVNVYSKRLKVLNLEVNSIVERIYEKKYEIANTRKAIKDLSGKKIENSPLYQNVIQENEVLKKELDEHTKYSLQLKDEAKNAQNNVENSRRKQAEKGQYTKKIKEKIESLREEIVKRKKNESNEEKIYQDLVTGIARSECRSAEMSIETRTLAIECEKELNKLEELKQNNKFLQNENEAYLKKISKMSHETLEKLWYK